MNPKMKQVITGFVFIGLLAAFTGAVWAGGSGVGPKTAPLAPKSAFGRTWVYGGSPPPRFWDPRGYNYFYPNPYRYGGYYGQPIVIISPAYYPYYVPPTIVVSSPYYCLAHQVGWVSRAGMLDHLSGTHKIPLESAASVCPDGGASCIVDGY